MISLKVIVSNIYIQKFNGPNDLLVIINHIKQFSAPHTVLLLTFIDRFIASRYGPLIIFLIPYLNIYVSLYRAAKTIFMYKKSIFETSYRICNSKICVAIHIVPENVLYVLMTPIYLLVKCLFWIEYSM